jgi:hypothetical protein
MKIIAQVLIGSLLGVITALAGYPVFDFATKTFSAKNTLILFLATTIVGIIVLIIPKKD